MPRAPSATAPWRAPGTPPSACARGPSRMGPPAMSIASCAWASPADLGERGAPLRQRLGALCGQQHRLAAEKIAGLRQVLVRMDHEQHAGCERRVVVEADIAG